MEMSGCVRALQNKRGTLRQRATRWRSLRPASCARALRNICVIANCPRVPARARTERIAILSAGRKWRDPPRPRTAKSRAAHCRPRSRDRLIFPRILIFFFLFLGLFARFFSLSRARAYCGNLFSFQCQDLQAAAGEQWISNEAVSRGFQDSTSAWCISWWILLSLRVRVLRLLGDGLK